MRALLLLLAAWLAAADKPNERCGGQTMYYTPLVQGGSEVGVCDSSCLAIPSSNTTLNRHRHGKKRLDAALFHCDDTPTLPEDDLDPETFKSKFPFHTRTCWAAAHHAKEAQIEFEAACKQADGQFTNPLFKTWLE